MTNWRETTLDAIASVIMGQSPPGDTCRDDEVGVPLLNGPTEFGDRYPSPVQFTSDPKRFCEVGDVLFCVRGSTTGRMNWADRQYAIGRGLAAIRHKDGLDFQPFLKGMIDLNLPSLLAVATGSTFPNVSRNDILGIKCFVPDKKEQKRIAGILSSLDKKIELNRGMNETLEAMARAVFQSWFVDFDPVLDNAAAAGNAVPAELKEKAALRKKQKNKSPLPKAIQKLFPNSFEPSPLGPIPKGWEVGKISDCCKKIENGGTPKRSEASYWTPADIPWLTSGEVRQDIVIDTQNYISQKGYKNSSAKIWDQGVTVVALYGATAGQVCFLAKELCTNQACCGLTPLPEYTYYNYMKVSSSVKLYEQQARGSAQQNLSKQIVSDLPVIIPPELILKNFNSSVAALFEKWIANIRINIDISELRDTLLPKLLTGEIEV